MPESAETIYSPRLPLYKQVTKVDQDKLSSMSSIVSGFVDFEPIKVGHEVLKLQLKRAEAVISVENGRITMIGKGKMSFTILNVSNNNIVAEDIPLNKIDDIMKRIYNGETLAQASSSIDSGSKVQPSLV
jgi:hypothetical protein